MGKEKETTKNEPQKMEEEGKQPEEQSKPCCACCCSSDQENPLPEHLRDGNIFENRSCTDCCMIFIYAIFFIAWIILISLAAKFGKPDRILKPENFRGELCGDGRLSAYPAYFVPLPTHVDYGICVMNCPAVGDIVCNNDLEVDVTNSSATVANHYFDQTAAEFVTNTKAYGTCKTSSCDAATQKLSDRYIATQLKLKQKKCFVTFYPSGPSLLRCIPGKAAGTVNTTLLALANESATSITDLANTFGVGGFFSLGFSELQQCWPVILISAGTCMALALIWVLLLRWILAPIVYFCILLILGILIGLGFVFKYFADDLESGSLPGEASTDNQVKLWRAGQWAVWIIAGIYTGVMLHMLQRIRIAIAIMKEASRAFTSAPSMIFVPMFTFIGLIGWIAFFIATSIYIQTIGSEAQDYLTQSAKSLLGEAVNISALVSKTTNSSIALNTSQSIANSINVTKWTTLPNIKYLHAFNFFGILWVGNICIMFGFMTMVMTVCSWYFSATQIQMRNANSEDEAQREAGKVKSTVAFVVPRAAWVSFTKHLGTVIWGALLIAIIQFIRAVFTYIAENYLKDVKDNWAAKILLRIAECCLWYIEQVVKIISKNAFIITAIRNTNFCVSAFSALKLLICNAARLIILTMLSTATIWLVKLFIVGINFFIAFGLMKSQSLTHHEPVQSGLFPMFLIFIMSFVIASLFMNVYEACIDTIFLCFLVDEEDYNAEFMPETLAEIVDLFKGAEEARLQYEKTVKTAMVKADGVEAKHKQ